MDVPSPQQLLAGRYLLERVLGEGAHSVVAAARDTEAGCCIAIKRIRRVLASRAFAARVLRELRFLRLLAGHENLVAIKDVLVPENGATFSDTFVVFELMPCDLYRVINSTSPLNAAHVNFLMFQLLRAVNYIHGAGIVHGELRASNLLVDEACQLKVCGFGLARAAARPTVLQEDWHVNAAPELCTLPPAPCSPAADMWACGCIFAEMLLRRPLRERSMACASISVHMALPLGMDPAVLRLIDALLEVDAGRRITAHEALMDDYFASWRRQLGFGPAPRRPEAQDLDFEQRIGSENSRALERLRRELLVEICAYHPEKRTKLLVD